jgi:hypothetical protein
MAFLLLAQIFLQPLHLSLMNFYLLQTALEFPDLPLGRSELFVLLNNFLFLLALGRVNGISSRITELLDLDLFLFE